ncbi:hypothetical protein BpHYR1_008658 [Brachionus plicatilis]|uniref:Uncharacterized protein n=1 Tax=Brachionus plicatilis TaxID=10195 RepID=A0A3M7TBP3_BRAPC|nr:hypothetical protein BpHYR1_008658 [Brachionus plicatilis]
MINPMVTNIDDKDTIREILKQNALTINLYYLFAENRHQSYKSYIGLVLREKRVYDKVAITQWSWKDFYKPEIKSIHKCRAPVNASTGFEYTYQTFEILQYLNEQRDLMTIGLSLKTVFFRNGLFRPQIFIVHTWKLRIAIFLEGPAEDWCLRNSVYLRRNWQKILKYQITF